MIPNLEARYIAKLADDFRNNFEKKTGKTIDIRSDFDMTEFINFYGGVIEYANLYEEVYQLDSIIYKVKEDNDVDFKIVIDKNKSEAFKRGDWNLAILRLFYYVIASQDKLESMQVGDIIYPNADYVKEALLYKSLIQGKSVNSEEDKIISAIQSASSLEDRTCHVKRLERLRGAK